MGIYAPIATGVPAWATRADLEPPPAESVLCACGCGRDVQPDVYEHYKDEDGNVFVDLDCVMRYYGVRYVG